jgi:hypothetical protein
MYFNETPIDDEMTVLDLLACGWGDATDREISLWPHAPPHVAVTHLRDFGQCPVDRILITPDAARRLKENGCVIGEPRWGYREEHVLRITKAGEARLWANEAKKTAQHGFTSLRWIRAWRSNRA